MKDAKEPKRWPYDLQPVRLFKAEEGEEIHSLAVRNDMKVMVIDVSKN